MESTNLNQESCFCSVAILNKAKELMEVCNSCVKLKRLSCDYTIFSAASAERGFEAATALLRHCGAQ
eukprot:scaffold19629_cov147-Amphora_coffeaeformis.AAC.4